MTEIGLLIRQLRKNKKMSLRELDAETGIDFNDIRKIEAGQIPFVSFYNLYKLLIALGQSHEEIMKIFQSKLR